MASHADRQPAAQIKLPALRVVWRASAAPTAKWLLALVGYELKGTSRQLIFLVSLRGLLLWGTGAAVAGYFLGLAALAWWWGTNPYNQITYADLVLPTRWSQLREKRGQARVDEGLHDLRTGKFGTGMMLLNGGLARKPDDFRGRLALAQINMSLGYLYRGLQILEDGLDYGTPPQAYLDSLFRLSVYLEDYERVLAIADRLESKLPPDDSRLRRRLIAQRATALEKLQRYDELEKLRNASQDTPSFTLEAAWARAQAARGQPQDALRELARDPDRFGVIADRCKLQLALAVAANDVAAADMGIRDWLAAEPTSAQARTEEIVALIALGEETRARDRLQRYFINFGSDRPAVILLIKKITELADVTWLRRARREADDYGSWSIEMRVLYVQGLILSGNIPEALTEFNLASELISKSRIPDGGWSDATKRMLEVIISDSPTSRSQFLSFFRSKRVSPDAVRFALKSLQKNGPAEVATELAILARNRFPALREASPSAFAAVVAQKAATIAGITSEAQARVELRALDAELADGQYDAASDRLRKIEAGGFTVLSPELRLRRIELHGLLEETSPLSAVTQLYLAQPQISQSRLRNLALKFQSLGRAASAEIVAREVSTRFADAKWATALLPAAEQAERSQATPSAPAPVVIQNELTARQALRGVDAALATGRYQEALNRLKDIERAKISALQPELMLRRINAHGSLREQAELSAVLGYYLSGNNPNLTALRDLAIKWDNDEQRDSALSLLRKTLAKFPQARWATDLRKKIEGDLVIAPEEKLLEPKKP